jgi:hypothetical protein
VARSSRYIIGPTLTLDELMANLSNPYFFVPHRDDFIEVHVGLVIPPRGDKDIPHLEAMLEGTTLFQLLPFTIK